MCCVSVLVWLDCWCIVQGMDHIVRFPLSVDSILTPTSSLRPDTISLTVIVIHSNFIAVFEWLSPWQFVFVFKYNYIIFVAQDCDYLGPVAHVLALYSIASLLCCVARIQFYMFYQRWLCECVSVRCLNTCIRLIQLQFQLHILADIKIWWNAIK